MPDSPLLAGMTKSCGRYTKLFRDAYKLENNVWNDDVATLPSYQQCIFVAPAPSEPRYGWNWDFPGENIHNMPWAYPEIIYGKKPWHDDSTTPKLPRQLTTIPSLKVDFSLQIDATGKYNSAFEIWLTSDAAAPSEHITTEIMFWVGSAGSPQPAGNFITTITLQDGRTCDVWSASMGWTYFAFVFHEPFSSGQIELGYYLEFLRQKQWIDTNHYIASFEYGNEIWRGQGTTVIDRYEVTLSDSLDLTPSNPPVNPPVVPPPVNPPVEPPVDPVDPPVIPNPPAPSLDPTIAYIQVELPETAIVFIDNHRMQSTGIQRLYRSPAIQPGMDFIYHMRIVFQRVGSVFDQTYEIVVRAGTKRVVSFMDLLVE